MGHDDRIEVRDPLAQEGREEDPPSEVGTVPAAAVDEDGAAAVTEEDGVALPDVEEGELAAVPRSEGLPEAPGGERHEEQAEEGTAATAEEEERQAQGERGGDRERGEER
jgi:hypothetical protein